MSSATPDICAQSLFEEHQADLQARVTRLFVWLLLAQWVAGIATALLVSPRTWAGSDPSIHIHVLAAIFVGGAIVSLPVYCGLRRPTATSTRHLIAAGQMLWSALFIHLSGGRIESHFHIFGSLAFLAFYRDWRVLVTASSVVAVDHFVRGLWWPQSVFGMLTASPYRWLEHTAWVVFEDVFLIAACRRGVSEMRQIAERRASLERTNESIELQVRERTRALQASEERFQLAVAGSAEGIWDWDVVTDTVYYAPRFKELLGHADHEMENRFDSFESRLHPDDHEAVMEALAAHLSDRTPYDVELRLRMKSGDHRWFRARGQAVWNEDGNPSRMAGSITDITDRKNAESALRRTQMAVDRTADAVFWIDRDGRFTEVNDAACALVGHERAALLRLSVFDIEVLDVDAWNQRWHEIVRDESVSLETVHRHSDGHDVPVLVTANHVEVDGRALNCAFARDITIRKHDEEQLLEAKRAAEHANRAKSEFLAAMSHELRTPLNAIIGFTDGLLDRADRHPLNDHQKNRLTRVKLAGQHLLALINDILDIAKVEAGEMNVNLTEFDPGDVAREVAELTEALAGEKQGAVKFTLDVADDLPSVESDREKVKQVLVNLLSNAVKFTDDGRVALVLRQDGEFISFSCEDTGIGIPHEEISRIFDKFHQVGGVHREGGTGLGLALCREFADLLHGYLTVRSIEGEGSAFTLTIPIDRSSIDFERRHRLEDELRERAANGPSRSEQTVVVCVEDNADNLLVLYDYLTDAGVHVVPVLDSNDAMEIVERCVPDLILLDVMMPGLDGWELLRRFKANPQTRDIPVVLTTAIEERGIGLSLGADDYLVKPIGRADLVRTVEQLRPGRTSALSEVAIVDDDPVVRDLLGEQLADLGIATRSFENGALFLAALDSWKPDVVLLDLMMPEIDGFGVIERLRHDPTTRDIPVVVLTAMILSSAHMLQLNRHVRLVVEKNGMSRETTLGRITDYLQTLARKETAA